MMDIQGYKNKGLIWVGYLNFLLKTTRLIVTNFGPFLWKDESKLRNAWLYQPQALSIWVKYAKTNHKFSKSICTPTILRPKKCRVFYFVLINLHIYRQCTNKHRQMLMFLLTVLIDLEK